MLKRFCETFEFFASFLHNILLAIPSTVFNRYCHKKSIKFDFLCQKVKENIFETIYLSQMWNSMFRFLCCQRTNGFPLCLSLPHPLNYVSLILGVGVR